MLVFNSGYSIRPFPKSTPYFVHQVRASCLKIGNPCLRVPAAVIRVDSGFKVHAEACESPLTLSGSDDKPQLITSANKIARNKPLGVRQRTCGRGDSTAVAAETDR